MKKDRIQEVITRAITAQSMSHMCMMLGSAFAANQAIFLKMLSEGYSPNTSIIAAVSVAVIVAGFVDGTLKGWLPFTIASFVGKKDRKTGVERHAWFNWVVRILTIVLLFVTTYLNVGLTPDIVDKTVGEADTSQQDHRTDRALNKYEGDLAIYTANKNDATAILSDLEKNKKTRTAELIAAKTNQKIARLWMSGNTWVLTPDCKGCSSAIRSAQRQTNKDIQTAQQNKDKAISALSGFMATSGKATDQVLLSANTEIEILNTENKASKKTWTGLMMVIMIISTVVFIGSTLIIVVYEEETGEDVDRRATVGNISKAAFFKAKNWLTKGVVRKTGLDKFVVATTLAGVGSFPIMPHTQGNTEYKARKPEQDTEAPQRKNKCNTDNQHRKTQKNTETTNTEPIIIESQNRVGDRWPTPNANKQWKLLVKKAREWAKQSKIANTEKTREKNENKWSIFCDFAAQFGYRCGVSDSGTAFITLDDAPEIIEDEAGTGTAVWGKAWE